MIDTILEFVIIAIVTGSVYALCAIGVTLIFGVLDVVNVSHGEFFALGGYISVISIATMGQNPMIQLIAVIGISFAFGIMTYRFLLAPLKARAHRKTEGTQFLVLTLGLSIFLQSAMLALGGANYLRVLPLVSGVLDLGFSFISYQRIIIVLVAGTALSTLFLFLRFHSDGQAIRAAAENPDAAQAVGVNLARTFAITVGISFLLAGLAGALMAPIMNVYPMVGIALTIKSFAIVILGGMGSVVGTLVASFVLSFAETFSTFVIPTQWRDVIAFVTMLLVLFIWPQGIGGRGRKK